MLDDRDSGADELDDEDDVSSTLDAGDDLHGTPTPWNMGPDGIPRVPVVTPSSAPPFSPTHCPCLRGPCKYLWIVRTHFEHGNAPGTLATSPTYRKLICTSHPGVNNEMSADAPVLECNRWVPLDAGALISRKEMIARYFKKHPEHDPSVAAQHLEDELEAAQPAYRPGPPTYQEIVDGASAGTDS